MSFFLHLTYTYIQYTYIHILIHIIIFIYLYSYTIHTNYYLLLYICYSMGTKRMKILKNIQLRIDFEGFGKKKNI